MRARCLTALLLSFYLVVTNSSFAQQHFNYENEWVKADSLIYKNGLTSTALSFVNNIYTAARKEENEPQRIKALVYILTLQRSWQENAEIKNIRQIEGELNGTNE